FLKVGEIKRITIKETQKTTQDLAKYENDNMPSNIFMFISQKDIVSYDKYTKDITTRVFDKAKSSLPTKSMKKTNLPSLDLTKVFIVHGRDDLAKTEVARFVEKLGFSAIILHEQASSGKTIIEKIEAHTNVGFAIILYTPCDTGGFAGENILKPRARQNVVFEHGYLIGKLGRHNVCALVKGDVEIPNDISGVVYVPLDSHSAWHLSIAKELRNAGYPVDMNKII
ncbi:TIR domain-containing protein, partial [Providencia huashanensis]|uniref:TIR domain-containing protein n=1 Tax=Providencia huashanensis TaxID=3037798 RepID=UPI0040464593